MVRLTLENFYHTKEWEKLTKQIRLQRTNDDGLLICEYCGKPIVRPYDAICHHKIYLDAENVNKPEIAFDPENIAVVHHRCHNLIHEKLQTKRKEVYLIYGSPLSGKSSYALSNMMPGDLLLDIDRIWQAISGQEPYIKPRELNANVFDIWHRLLDQVKTRLGDWRCAYIVGGFPLSAERERICRSTGAREIYIESTKEECLKRIDKSERDRESWTKFIEDWWTRYAPPPSE